MESCRAHSKQKHSGEFPEGIFMVAREVLFKNSCNL